MHEDHVTLRLTIQLDAEDVRRLGGLLGATRPSWQPPAPPPQHLGRLLTTEEAAELLGISKASLYGLRYTSDAPLAVKVGGRLRWRRADVEAYVEQHVEQRPKPRW